MNEYKLERRGFLAGLTSLLSFHKPEQITRESLNFVPSMLTRGEILNFAPGQLLRAGVNSRFLSQLPTVKQDTPVVNGNGVILFDPSGFHGDIVSDFVSL